MWRTLTDAFKVLAFDESLMFPGQMVVTPIDLLGTSVGIKLVEQHLERMALGVYA